MHGFTLKPGVQEKDKLTCSNLNLKKKKTGGDIFIKVLITFRKQRPHPFMEMQYRPVA